MDIHESIAQIMQSQEVFGESFYEVFLERYPDVQQFFADTDMKRQAVVLTLALSLIEQYYSCGYPVTERYLNYLGTQHHARQIPRELYPQWRDAMLIALQRFFGNDWSEELADQWKEAIAQCTRVMFKGYDKPFTI